MIKKPTLSGHLWCHNRHITLSNPSSHSVTTLSAWWPFFLLPPIVPNKAKHQSPRMLKNCCWTLQNTWVSCVSMSVCFFCNLLQRVAENDLQMGLIWDLQPSINVSDSTNKEGKATIGIVLVTVTILQTVDHNVSWLKIFWLLVYRVKWTVMPSYTHNLLHRL